MLHRVKVTPIADSIYCLPLTYTGHIGRGPNGRMSISRLGQAGTVLIDQTCLQGFSLIVADSLWMEPPMAYQVSGRGQHLP